MSDQNTGMRIQVATNGPYLVSGAVPLSRQTIEASAEGASEAWTESEPFPVQKNYALCRCGASSNKPYCDGTHARIHFDGTETADRAPYLQIAGMIDGPELALTDAEKLCAFARFCDPNGQVWRQVADTDNPDVRETFIRQVGNCPAGRLVAWNKANGAPLEPDLPLSIGLIEDPVEQCSGPLWIRGGIAIVSSDGFEYEIRNRVTLCRCGASRNKPLCDGSHAQIKFRE